MATAHKYRYSINIFGWKIGFFHIAGLVFPVKNLFQNIQEPKKLVLNFMTVNLINIITMLSFNHISKVTHHQIIETNLVFLRFLKLAKSAHGSNLSLPKVGRSKKNCNNLYDKSFSVLMKNLNF